MNYIGSKYKFVPFLKKTITSVCGSDLSQKVFCDLFAGTGSIGRLLKQEVKQMISNDIEFYSFILNKNYIENHQSLRYKEIIENLNKVKLTSEGFIYKNYCLGGSGNRQYFSDINGQKIDAIREEIAKYEIFSEMYYFLLASLLESADKVANTASVYGAYLKKIKRSAQKNLILEPALFEISNNMNIVYNEDANILIEKIKGDILYLDPPYNHRQYGANYHILNTIALYDIFLPKGKTGVRDYVSSSYCKVSTVFAAFEEIIQKAHFPYIFVSYSDEGLMSKNEIRRVMQKYGKYDMQVIPHQRFKAYDNKQCKNFTLEYLHILEKF